MKFIKTDLVPCYQLAPVSGLPGCWQAEWIDPQFEIYSKSQLLSLTKGYYIFEITNNDGLANIYNPTLFFDNGSGYTAENQIPVVFQHVQGEVYRAYIVLPQDSVALRFDPTELHAKFNITSFKVIRCLRSEWYLSTSRLVMARRRSQGITLAHDLKRTREYVSQHGARGLAAKLRSLIGYAQRQSSEVTANDYSLQLSEFSRLSPSDGPAASSSLRMFSEYFRYNSAIAEGYRSPDFAPDRINEVASDRLDVKLIAYYLPQFHRFEENDLWWGKGFTEWTNVTKAVPRFAGHYQPKLSGDLGYYDLKNVEVMREQAALAKKFGLSGFCFHFYWFGGKRLMETPVLNYLAAQDIDFNYSLCWANENWSRRWDGAEHEMLIGQKHSPEDDIAFIEYVAKYFADKRYTRIDDKPVLTIYRPDILPDAKATVKRWRAAVKRLGFPGIYLIATNSFGFTDYKKYGFDALSEFPPHAVEAEAINDKVAKYDNRHAGGIFAYKSLVNWQRNRKNIPEGIVFPGVMPAWDNVARRPLAGHVFHNSTPEAYREWLMAAINRVRKTNPADQRIVMINAWNEWAEGAFLEPDRLNGHAYLWATSSAVEDSIASGSHAAKLKRVIKAHNDAFAPKGTHAIAAHIYYQDTLEDLKESLSGKEAIDIYITIPTTLDVQSVKLLLDAFPRSFVMPVANCGRDVLPFLKIMRKACEHPYEWICKVHSKKSVHLGQGNLWRRELFGMLFDGLSTNGKQAHNLLPKSSKIGMLAPAGSMKSLSETWTVQNNKEGMDSILSKLKLGQFASDYTKHSFFAGTMFWFRPAALEVLIKSKLSDEDFGVELGRVDGTPAHAMERLFGVICAAKGFKLAELANAKSVSVDISLAKRDRK